VTVIGALNSMGGIVLCADRQETLADYAKWDVEKIKTFEMGGTYRLFMSGAGDADTIDMVWEETLRGIAGPQFEANPYSYDQLKDYITRVVRIITKRCVFPAPYGERPRIHLIWAIQQLEASTRAPWEQIQLFRTRDLAVNSISGAYFTGSPLLITRYLTDSYLRGLAWSVEEAQALAAYILWEAKEYDPNCGKNSDIIVLKHGGEVRRIPRQEIAYWEEHFAHLKSAMKILPLLSCATQVADNFYNPSEHLGRFKTAMHTLTRQQKKMRQRTGPESSRLAKELMKNLRKEAAKHNKPTVPKKRQSAIPKS
jgi:hypothetical protein